MEYFQNEILSHCVSLWNIETDKITTIRFWFGHAGFVGGISYRLQGNIFQGFS